MGLPEVLQNLSLVLASGLGGALLARFFRLPVLVGYLFGGVVVGAVTGGRLSGDSTLLGLANFGVAMLLFSTGVELSLSGLKNSGRFVVVAAVSQIAVTIGIVAFFATVFGMQFDTAIFFAVSLSLSSTAVVVKILEGSGKLGSMIGEISVTWMLVQDLLVIPFLLLLPVIVSLEKGGDVFGSLAELLVKSALVLVVIGLIGRRVGKYFLSKLAQTDTLELLVLGIAVWVVAFASASIWLGLTLTLGVFLAGVLLGESNKETAVLSVTRPIRDLFGALFFTSLGLFLTPQTALSLLVITIVGGSVVFLLKFFVSFGILKWFGFHTRLAAEVSAPIAGVGEFAFLIMGLGRSLGFVDATTFNFVVSLTLFSIAATPVFNGLVEKISSKSGEKESFSRNNHSEYSDHVVLCGFGRVGLWVGEALVKEHIKVVVIDYRHQSLATATELGIPVVYGDAANDKVLEKSGVTLAKMVIVTIPDTSSQKAIIEKVKDVNPQAIVIGRVNNISEKRNLSKSGATHIVQPEFEASLSIVNKVLDLMGKPKGEIGGVVKDLKSEYEV